MLAFQNNLQHKLSPMGTGIIPAMLRTVDWEFWTNDDRMSLGKTATVLKLFINFMF